MGRRRGLSRSNTVKHMRYAAAVLILIANLFVGVVLAGEAEIRAAQSTINSQIKAFLAKDHASAYSYAAPNVKRLFPTLDAFMGMVTGGYEPVYRPRNYTFGKVEELSPTSIIQEVLLVGPDGRDYRAVYTLERQPDGVYRITGVSLLAANSLSA
jgi:hypothetical protein